MRRLAGAMRLQVGDIVRAVQQIERLAEGRRGRILIDQRDAAEMMTAVDILVQEHRPDMPEIGIDDGGSLRNRPTVPRMPIVATGVLIFMPSPVWATWPATKAKVPSTKLKISAVRGAVGLVIVFVERHPRVVHKVKRRAVREGDAAGGVGGGLDDVGLVDRIADMQRTGDAVMDQRDVADDLFHLADGFRRQCRLRLRVLSGRRRAGQEVDQVARKMRAVRRDQVGMLFGGEIAGDDETVAVLSGQDQIGTRADKVPPEQSSASEISIRSACDAST